MATTLTISNTAILNMFAIESRFGACWVHDLRADLRQVGPTQLGELGGGHRFVAVEEAYLLDGKWAITPPDLLSAMNVQSIKN